MNVANSNAETELAKRGRPKHFDREEALQAAMHVFWARGYEGASIQDLTAAMGINKPSLYSTFGCKEELFREAVSLYDKLEGAIVSGSLDAATSARSAIEDMLRANAKSYTSPEKPRGCMIVLASLLGAPDNQDVRTFLTENRLSGEQALRQRLERGLSDGDLVSDANIDQLAAFYTTVLEGLSIQARDGASSNKLSIIIDAAMMAWPQKKEP